MTQPSKEEIVKVCEYLGSKGIDFDVCEGVGGWRSLSIR